MLQIQRSVAQAVFRRSRWRNLMMWRSCWSRRRISWKRVIQISSKPHREASHHCISHSRQGMVSKEAVADFRHCGSGVVAITTGEGTTVCPTITEAPGPTNRVAAGPVSHGVAGQTSRGAVGSGSYVVTSRPRH